MSFYFRVLEWLWFYYFHWYKYWYSQ